MIKLSGSWVGIETIAEEELRAARAPFERALLRALLHYESAVKKKLTGPRHGRVYWIGAGKRKRKHIASAPGEPPAVLFGKLRQSITHSDPMWAGDVLFGEVGTALPYGRILEWGGIAGNGARILPRPYFAPALLEQEDTLDAILQGASGGSGP